jgi:hypothetical protein
MNHTMRIPVLLACLTLLPCLNAQDAPPTVATPPDAGQVALAQGVIKAMHADRIFDQMEAQMQRMAAQAFKQNNDKLTPDQRAAAEKLSGQIMKVSMDAARGMLDKMDVIYAEVYSPAELKAMKAFFESPEGVSMLEKQPQIMQKLMPSITEMQKEIGPKIQKLVEDAKAQEAAAPTPTPAAVTQ